MIFNEMNKSVSYETVQESPYELGIGGALYHVYENECNYNALMRAVALSEMKYYTETGGDLFVQEAGALSGFAQKARAFFNKVIEKIKSIAKKFIAKINQYRLNDEDFVKKYKTELKSRDLAGFKFKGYKNFDKLEDKKGPGDVSDTALVDGVNDADNDELNKIIEKNRGNILGGDSLTESEFRTKLKEVFYGDKEEFPVNNIVKYTDIISGSKALITAANNEEKRITDRVKKYISNLENLIKKNDEATGKSLEGDGTMQDKDNQHRSAQNTLFNNRITVYKAFCNDMTVYFGAYVKALADKNRQAKAICVKALSYKHESASVYDESGTYGDIFAGVKIV